MKWDESHAGNCKSLVTCRKPGEVFAILVYLLLYIFEIFYNKKINECLFHLCKGLCSIAINLVKWGFSVIFYLRLCPTINSVHTLAWGHLKLFLSNPGGLWAFPSSALLCTTSLYFKCLFLGDCCHCPLDTLLLALPNVLHTHCTLHESCIPANVCQTVSC